jgi:hypothetical protein
MKSRAAIVGILALTTLAFATNAALARSILGRYCKSLADLGYTYFPANGNGVEICVNQYGNGWVCGGDVPAGHSNCERF